ncbi:hypothetical protein VP01_2803g1 [Puccinia sorghi]|uniref:Uncharacterized protein n=1 Tax=Puccinia sorghi TaxID=27349 RepID=A0A0L6V4B2_9BASI|nr:hypothetical protein VP01_2803g1 [Puccinia sorghi]
MQIVIATVTRQTSVITQTIDSANLCHIREHCCDTHGMWSAILKVHQDSTTGGRIYWLCKLLLARMEGNDTLGHINTMAQCYKQLNSLITVGKPLTPDDVHTAALLSSISQDWLHCITSTPAGNTNQRQFCPSQLPKPRPS